MPTAGRRSRPRATRSPRRSHRIAAAALRSTTDLLGWIAALPDYRGRVWELHPLVVRVDARRRGVGRALCEDLERVAAAEGALTMWIGADDDLGENSLGGVERRTKATAEMFGIGPHRSTGCCVGTARPVT